MCAWTCSAQSNSGLIQNLSDAGILISSRIKSTFLAVDRHVFVPHLSKSSAYCDSPQSIGHGATISAPHMHAYVLEALTPYLVPGARVLDVGFGSGILLACMSHLVQPGGIAVGVEHSKPLADSALRQLSIWDPQCISSGRIVCVVDDGRFGVSKLAPFKAIHVGAAASKIPQALIDQLDAPGRMIIPVGHQFGPQRLMQVDKDVYGYITQSKLMDVQYVPLTDLDHQLGS